MLRETHIIYGITHCTHTGAYSWVIEQQIGFLEEVRQTLVTLLSCGVARATNAHRTLQGRVKLAVRSEPIALTHWGGGSGTLSIMAVTRQCNTDRAHNLLLAYFRRR